MTDSSNSTESDPIPDPLVLVSDSIKSIYAHWQGAPISDDRSCCSSSGPPVRSVLAGRHETISAIARAEISHPDSDFAVKFSPMPKGQARLEVARVTSAEQAEAQAATTQPIPPQSPRRQHSRKPTPAYLAALASSPGIARVEMLPDGTVIAVSGEPSANNIEANPWDEVLIDAAGQKRPS